MLTQTSTTSVVASGSSHIFGAISSFAFVGFPRVVHHGSRTDDTVTTTTTTTTTTANPTQRLHLSKIHEETDDELRNSEDLAAIDAADCSDAGMEAVAEERAVMLANEMAHKKQQQQQKKDDKKKSDKSQWNEQHLVHGADKIHEETDDELRETEDAAAVDASDSSDAGIEAAMEERAVMLAREMAHKIKEEAAKKKKENKADKKKK
jgi:hypothetical protein